MRVRSTRALIALAAGLACRAALAGTASATKPGMTVKIPGSQDVDKVYVLAAIHQKNCTLLVSGTVMGHRFKGVKKRVTIHLTNQAFLRLSSSAERSVKKALRRGRTVRAKITVTAKNSSGERNSVTRSVKMKN